MANVQGPADSIPVSKSPTDSSVSAGGINVVGGNQAERVNLSQTPAPFQWGGGGGQILTNNAETVPLNRTPVHGPHGNGSMASPRTVAQSATKGK